MEPAATGTGMAPVAAVLTVFALVFGFISWLRLLRVGFGEQTALGLLAVFLPPLALLLLLPRWRQEREMFLLAAAALTFFCAAQLL
ncbi:hypothetical protein SAMN04487965_1771 [Microbulbifer donghaiensis]|uniref:Uncharacterized protein n=1 Tax=Microbulbifer donghaiensis TaxID=494016 RepID=A0A1M5A7V6_9GAMM|nr:hypothetical protein [Microbulbifer donghaiensis]SHF26116.1 hypothetical protein SAMN04487965_1771 [Microbulbifer donghaiensis]